MKIVMVSNEFPPSVGGVQTHVKELSRALIKMGHEVLVIAKASGEAPEGSSKLGPIEVIRVDFPGSHFFYDLKLRARLKKLIKDRGFDLIHVHGMRPLNATRNCGVPVVFTNHTSSFLRRAKKGAKTLKKMHSQLKHLDCVVAPSDELVQATRITGYSGPVKFISNGVDVDVFEMQESNIRTTLGIPENAFVAVLARRLVEKNGVLYFAKALAMSELSDLHVILAGDGEDRAGFENILRGTDIEHRVHYLGAVPNSQMPLIYSSGNVSVLPSLMEATSIAGLEAMACGLPVIGTKVGGIPVILDDGVTGFLVDPMSPEAIAERLTYLYNNRSVTERMGQAARRKVEEEFSWDRIASETLDLYRSVSDGYGF